jgi:YidC/Oxa1 family membrane protein insertase
MLLQFPILIALFWALRETFELRQAPFALWIKDLSLPDRVGAFPDAIPFIGGAGVHILPVLMSVAMLLQQKLMPKPEDPQAQQQQKIMRFLPFFFLFLFYRFPSGLCLYWFTSTVIGMGEQLYIRRHLDAMPAPGATTGKKKSGASGKSKKRK